VDRIIKAVVLTPFVSQKLASFTVKPNKEDLQFLKQLIEAGKLTPVIDRTYPLSETPEAIRYLENGHARGKERTCDLADREALRRCPESWSRCSSGGEEVVDWLERDALRARAKPPRRLVVACH
jgi:hypothetical protein